MAGATNQEGVAAPASRLVAEHITSALACEHGILLLSIHPAVTRDRATPPRVTLDSSLPTVFLRRLADIPTYHVIAEPATADPALSTAHIACTHPAATTQAVRAFSTIAARWSRLTRSYIAHLERIEQLHTPPGSPRLGYRRVVALSHLHSSISSALNISHHHQAGDSCTARGCFGKTASTHRHGRQRPVAVRLYAPSFAPRRTAINDI